MKNAIVFSGRNGLDFSELRAGVLRIPDVTLRLREAQEIFEELGIHVDLQNAIAADDDSFFRNIKLKSLVAAIVQIGLFDRYLKTQRFPDFLVGNSNGDSAMMVCVGRMTFRELIEASQALVTLRPQQEKVVPILPAETMPLLSGLSLTEYGAFRAIGVAPVGQRPECTPLPVDGAGASMAGQMDLKKILASLHSEHGVTRFVSVGPASALRGSDYRAFGSDEIESLDSIDLDPMLGWFWRNVRPAALALAQ